MESYVQLLELIQAYKEKRQGLSINAPICLRAGKYLYYFMIEEDGSILIFDRYDHFASAYYARIHQCVDEQRSLNAYMGFVDQLSAEMFHGFNRQQILDESLRENKESVIRFEEGAFPRFITSEEAEKLRAPLEMLNTFIDTFQKQPPQEVKEGQYYRYADLTYQIFVDDLVEELPHQRIQISVDDKALQALREKKTDGTWYVAATYLPIRLRGSEGFPLHLIIYDRDADHFVGNVLISYEKRSYLYHSFTDYASHAVGLPESLIVSDMKTLSYIRDFIDRFAIPFEVRYDIFFKKAYQYYDMLLENANEII